MTGKELLRRLAIFTPMLFLWWVVAFDHEGLEHLAIIIGITEIIFLKGIEG